MFGPATTLNQVLFKSVRLTYTYVFRKYTRITYKVCLGKALKIFYKVQVQALIFSGFSFNCFLGFLFRISDIFTCISYCIVSYTHLIMGVIVPISAVGFRLICKLDCVLFVHECRCEFRFNSTVLTLMQCPVLVLLFSKCICIIIYVPFIFCNIALLKTLSPQISGRKNKRTIVSR